MQARPKNGWRNTGLWQELTRRKDASALQVSAALEPLLSDLDVVLSAAGTSDANFTLHDAQHSLRVAERMADLLGAQLSEISPFDIGFSLGAAYAHDVGMTPDLGLVNAHFEALLVGMQVLSAEAGAEFQRWLDDERDGLVPPLVADSLTADRIQDARLIVAHYTRTRHNDWSEAWLRRWAQRTRPSFYEGWIDHLVRICRSHHEGYDRLSSAEFDPQLVGSPAGVLHLRHCAVLLRVADVLENDPERTPDIVFERRAVDESSWIHWRKDHYISVEQEGHRFTLTARPPNARMHHAVLETVAAIDAELQLCRRLADEHHFSVAPNLDRDLPNRWDYESRVRATVAPLDDGYEYVDGTFRPDVRRVLQLLGGVDLYGSSWAAVREMLQNGFDAVKEQIALERLAWREPLDEAGVAALRRQHLVRLELKEGEDGSLALTCTDTGVGMTKERIVQRFLVSGSGKRHDDRDLERRCETAGFALEKTARFGIGVLSYFLLGPSVVVETRRSFAAPDHDRVAWRFTSGGPGTFGELTRGERDRSGTTVEVLLRPGVGGEGLGAVARSLRDYLVATVQRVPCSFQLTAPEGVDTEPLRWEPGWTPLPHDVGDSRGLELRDDPPARLPSEREEQERRASDLAAARVTYRNSLRWLTDEGALPDGLGQYRVAMPWWETKLGPALAPLLDFQGNGLLEPVLPPSTTILSWNGMRVRVPEADEDAVLPKTLWTQAVHAGAVVSIDLIADKAAAPAVSRNLLLLEKPAERAFEFVSRRIQTLATRFAAAHPDSPTAMLNRAFAGHHADENTPLWWLVGEGAEAPAPWAPVRFPVAIPRRIGQVRTLRLRYAGAPLPLLESLMVKATPGSWTSTAHVESLRLVPDRIVPIVKDGVVEDVMAVVTRDTRGSDAGCVVSFPAEWDEISAAAWTGQCMINASHPVSKLVDSHDPLGLGRADAESVLEAPERLCTSAEHVVAEALSLASWGGSDVWDALVAARPEVVEEAYRLLASAGLPGGRLSVVSADHRDQQMRVATFTEKGCYLRPLHVLPVPDGDVIEAA